MGKWVLAQLNLIKLSLSLIGLLIGHQQKAQTQKKKKSPRKKKKKKKKQGKINKKPKPEKKKKCFGHFGDFKGISVIFF
jgi:hypothetical protein